MATNKRVISRSMRTIERSSADPRNVYWLSSASSTNIYVVYELSYHVIFISVLISCRSLLAKLNRKNLHPLRHTCVCRQLHDQTSYIVVIISIVISSKHHQYCWASTELQNVSREVLRPRLSLSAGRVIKIILVTFSLQCSLLWFFSEKVLKIIFGEHGRIVVPYIRQWFTLPIYIMLKLQRLKYIVLASRA